MNYPLLSEYKEAILWAEDNFEAMNMLRSVKDERGEPIMSSGNFAVVFKMEDIQTKKLYAVKCFLKEQDGRAESYQKIARELEFVKSSFLTSIKYLEKELYVSSQATSETEFPILLMDWVDGVTLDNYLREHLHESYTLAMLSFQFSRLATWLLTQPFAHGDLKPDNILVRQDGRIMTGCMYRPCRAKNPGSWEVRISGIRYALKTTSTNISMILHWQPLRYH